MAEPPHGHRYSPSFNALTNSVNFFNGITSLFFLAYSKLSELFLKSPNHMNQKCIYPLKRKKKKKLGGGINLDIVWYVGYILKY
jgi:hypothetical protein